MGEKGFSGFATTMVEEPEILNSSVKESHSFGIEQEVLDEDVVLSGKGFCQFGSEVEAGHGQVRENFMEQQQLHNEKNNFGGAFGLDSDNEEVQLHNHGFKHKPHDSNEDRLQKIEEPSCSLDDCREPNSQISNGLETLWEHQELIEQLKMELRKVRATGLPTILEESESPKMMEDLKPWKIHDDDERKHHDDSMNEHHKFYKSYRDRMRKFDILNYQKMYAIGFFQLKDPLQSMSSKKISSPAITAILSQNFRLFKRKKIECDLTMKFIAELYIDLEVIYVGHLCLSWEFLHWQYEKALELWELDSHGMIRYNYEVAEEFQQFQVLMQRFIENEPFQGPRVQNYVKTRCVLCNLLQVPAIKGDGMKGGLKGRTEFDSDGITSNTLVEMMEESIRIFWRFVQADKDTASRCFGFRPFDEHPNKPSKEGEEA